MMMAILYLLLIFFTVWCQATYEDSFGYPPNITNHRDCGPVDKRNESHLSPQLGTNQSQPCVVTFNDSDISAILKLARNKIINIVDIKFQWNLSNNQIGKTHWVWTNRLGLEILSLSQELSKMKMTGYLATKSLNVGRQVAQLAVLENPSKCVLKENSNDFLAMKLLKRLSFSGNESELCYKTQIDTWYLRCCKIKSFNDDKKDTPVLHLPENLIL